MFDEPDSPAAVALLARWVESGIRQVAPPTLNSEVANALWRKVRTRVMAAPAGEEALQKFLTLGVNLVWGVEIDQRAWYWTQRLGLPTIYDAYYLAVAEQEGAELWTADRE